MAEFDAPRNYPDDAVPPESGYEFAAVDAAPARPEARTPPAADRPAAENVAPTLAVRVLGWVIPFALFSSVLLAVLYFAPMLLLHWRQVEAESQAEVAYQKRRAELKAELEHAQELMNVLDKKTKLTSLGFRSVVQMVTPQVVNIAGFRTPKAGELALAGKFGGLLYDPNSQQHWFNNGVGSGLLVKPGYVLTNHHVIKKVERLRVTFASGQSVWVDPARVASDPDTDLAVIKLPDNPTGGLRDDYNQTTVFADSNREVECGDLVLALGSPHGLKNTVTHGVISAKGRFLDQLDRIELLQTDAPINPGNSGGPLFDLYGRVVGINVLIVSDTGHSQGIGFAIPSNTAKAIFDELVEKGEVVRGFIGVEMEEVSPLLARDLNLEEKGVVAVKKAMPGYPAATAGLQKGDLIIALDGKDLPLTDPLSFFRQRVMEAEIGTRIAVTVLRVRERNPVGAQAQAARDVQQLVLTVEVGAKPKFDQVP
jgi:S1-C subfamily serine protease